MRPYLPHRLTSLRIGVKRSSAGFRTALVLAAVASAACAAPAWSAEGRPKPNIIVILADDLGYGDVKANNPEGKIATPNFDRLAAEGMRFTDCHSGSAVCTPTRYGLLTGRYSWRTTLAHGVLGGFSPPLIEPGRATVASLLKQQGYHTACIGKWHLGMTMPLKASTAADPTRRPGQDIDYAHGWGVDYARPIANGPNAVGFDYYFGISASLDMPPFVFIENDKFTSVPTTEKKWIRTGPAAADFEAVDVLPRITAKAVEYVGQRAEAARKGQPFFLYWPLNSPHTPIVPTEPWQGRSGLNAYGDFVMQTDAAVGQLMDALKKHSLDDNTLVLFTSDNGCSPSANFAELRAKGHDPSYQFRGHKADIFDGGHRVPLLVRWPGQTPAGAVSNDLVCLTDVLATCAEIVGFPVPASAGEDSFSLAPALRGTKHKPARETVVHHSINGSFAIRRGQWKLELCPGSGGWSAPKPFSKEERGLPKVQLYDLDSDIGEKKNVADAHPELVAELEKQLQQYVDQGRSTPGAQQRNARAIDIWGATRPRPKAAKAK